jgi:hypothetical protein
MAGPGCTRARLLRSTAGRVYVSAPCPWHADSRNRYRGTASRAVDWLDQT